MTFEGKARMNNNSELQMPRDDGTYPLEPKVNAARLAAGVAALLAAIVLKTLPFLAGYESLVVEVITDLLIGLIALLAAWWAGWKAKHVQRPQAGGNAVLPEQ